VELTPNLGLKKPEENDYYNVQNHNDNMDSIDERMGELSEVATISKDGLMSKNDKVRLSELDNRVDNLSTPATTSKLGIIKVGSNLSITSDGTLSSVASYSHPTTKQCSYTAPVTSVAGRTGAVALSKTDIGLGSVENYGIATLAEAQAGASGVKYMTPERVKQAIQTIAPVGSTYTTISFSACTLGGGQEDNSSFRTISGTAHASSSGNTITMKQDGMYFIIFDTSLQWSGAANNLNLGINGLSLSMRTGNTNHGIACGIFAISGVTRIYRYIVSNYTGTCNIGSTYIWIIKLA
jgi:hypothetical protein